MLRRLIALVLLTTAWPAMAHEFWLEPLAYRVAPGERIAARARNGEFFEGVELSYSARGYAQSGIALGDATGRLMGDNGQRPAVQTRPLGPGLNILYHTSTASRLTYDDLTKFEAFLRGKRLEAALAQHLAEGLPTQDISEGYFRFAKALIAVGDGQGSDRALGLGFELVAETNPYTDQGDTRFRLLYRGQPRANAPAFVFLKRGEAVEKIELTTDAQGRFSVPSGPAEVMVNAVMIRPSSSRMREQMGTIWTTLWASTTYRVF